MLVRPTKPSTERAEERAWTGMIARTIKVSTATRERLLSFSLSLDRCAAAIRAALARSFALDERPQVLRRAPDVAGQERPDRPADGGAERA